MASSVAAASCVLCFFAWRLRPMQTTITTINIITSIAATAQIIINSVVKDVEDSFIRVSSEGKKRSERPSNWEWKSAYWNWNTVKRTKQSDGRNYADVLIRRSPTVYSINKIRRGESVLFVFLQTRARTINILPHRKTQVHVHMKTHTRTIQSTSDIHRSS